MVSEQHHVGLGEGLVRMRSCAFLSGGPIDEVTQAVVAGAPEPDRFRRSMADPEAADWKTEQGWVR
jgi:hypothetical protein